MNYLVKAKIDGKWKTLGNIKDGKYGPQLGIRKTDELREYFRTSGDWLNFALFEDDREEKGDSRNANPKSLDDSLPF